MYAGLATLIALLIAYPLAYVIAFRGGKWKNALLLLVILPFFITYLIRTLSWETILDDDGAVVDILKTVGCSATTAACCATSAAVIAGITYNFLPFMILPLYASLERIDPRMLEAGYDLYGTRRAVFTAGDAAAVDAGHRGRRAAHVHPGGGRLHQRRAARHSAADDDRQRDPEPLPGDHRLPDRGGALVHPDGDDPGDGARLGAVRGHRVADGRGGALMEAGDRARRRVRAERRPRCCASGRGCSTSR